MVLVGGSRFAIQARLRRSRSACSARRPPGSCTPRSCCILATPAGTDWPLCDLLDRPRLAVRRRARVRRPGPEDDRGEGRRHGRRRGHAPAPAHVEPAEADGADRRPALHGAHRRAAASCTGSRTWSSRSRSCRRRSAATSAPARRSGRRMSYSVEETPAGTAGSVRLAARRSSTTRSSSSRATRSATSTSRALVALPQGEGRLGHDRPRVRRQPARVRHRRDRRGRPDRALPREALVGPGVLGHDQHGHLRARARGAPSRAGRPSVRLLEGAVPAAARDGPAAVRLRAGRLLAGHRQPRPVPAGELRRAGRAGQPRPFRDSACAATSGSERASSSTTSSQVEGPAFVGNYCRISPTASIGPYAVLGIERHRA